MSSEATETLTIDREAFTALIERVELAIKHDLALSVEDMKLLLSAISTLCVLQSKLEKDDITLHKLRKLLGMVRQSEQRRKAGSKGRKGKKPRSRKRSQSSPPKVEHHKMQEHQRGDVCPGCQRGKLYKFDPAKLLRITGHARFESVHHIVEQLRCNGCQAIYKAPLPDAVLEDGDADQKYGYSARALMVIDKFYTGTPYYHQSNLADLFGVSISASTIFDQCELVANDIIPVFYELKRLASDAQLFLLDDTTNRILTQKPQWRDKPNGKGKRLRTGIYSSGLIATRTDGHEIILFETSLGHAGEHLDDVLTKRTPNLPPPLVMSDALSSNNVTRVETIRCYCNAHARRQFYDLENLYPKEIEWLLDTYGQIWEHEAWAKENKFTDSKRLTYHQKHSLPAMESIRQWALERTHSASFEEHSALGKAMTYFIKHYDLLIQFCNVPGAPIDNNRMEEKLKIVIRGRKLAHFYKTPNGAGVANVLISLIATAAQAGENIYDYLLMLQRHRDKVRPNAAEWLPWNYRATMAQYDLIREPDGIDSS